MAVMVFASKTIANVNEVSLILVAMTPAKSKSFAATFWSANVHEIVMAEVVKTFRS